MTILRPSKAMWDYYFEASWQQKNITPLSVSSAIADVIAGYGISYTALEVLKDLDLITDSGKPNKKARLALASYLHEKFHRNTEGLQILPPEGVSDEETD